MKNFQHISIFILIAIVMGISISQTSEAQVSQVPKMSMNEIFEVIRNDFEKEPENSIKSQVIEIVLNNEKLVYDPIIIDALKNSNKEFEELEDPHGVIDQHDKEWLSAGDEITPFMEYNINSNISEHLRQILKNESLEGTDFILDEIVLTNAYGAAIGQIQKTYDYDQADERWWQVASHSGFYFLTGYDQSLDKRTFDLSIRISDKEGNFLGVTKIVVSNNFQSDIYWVGTYLTNMKNIDLRDAEYDATFWVHIFSEKINYSIDNVPKIDFVNGVIKQKDNEEIGSNYYKYKAHGTFHNKMDFSNFPFAEVDLKIVLRAVNQDISHSTFFVDKGYSGTDKQIFLPGWILVETYTDSVTHHDENRGDFSEIIHHYSIKAPELASFITYLLPILVIGVITALVCGFNPKNFETKGQAFIGLLLASIFLHLFLDQTLPPLDYLTLTDKFMTILYVLIIFAVLEIPVQRLLNRENDYEKNTQINKKFNKFVIPITVGLATMILFGIL